MSKKQSPIINGKVQPLCNSKLGGITIPAAHRTTIGQYIEANFRRDCSRSRRAKNSPKSAWMKFKIINIATQAFK